MECDALFDVFNRRHHCRLCGRVVCQGCSPNKMSVKPKHIVQEPVKDETFAQFMARQKFDQERRGFQIVRVCVRCEDLTFDQAQHPLAGLSGTARNHEPIVCLLLPLIGVEGCKACTSLVIFSRCGAIHASWTFLVHNF